MAEETAVRVKLIDTLKIEGQPLSEFLKDIACRVKALEERAAGFATVGLLKANDEAMVEHVMGHQSRLRALGHKIEWLYERLAVSKEYVPPTPTEEKPE